MPFSYLFIMTMIHQFSKMKCLFLYMTMTFWVHAVSAQSKKETLKAQKAYYLELRGSDGDELRQGKHLELAKTLSNADLVRYLLEPNTGRSPKKYGLLCFEKIFSDTDLAYFLLRSDTINYSLYKASEHFYRTIDLSSLDKAKINSRFIEEILTEEERKYLGPDRGYEAYRILENNFDNDFRLLNNSDTFIINYSLLVEKRNFFKTKYRRYYRASYDIRTASLVKLYEGKRAPR